MAADDVGAPRTVLRGTLRDGLRVVIRSLVPADRDDVEHGFGELSERTKNLRFMTGKDHLSQRTLDSLVDRVDQHDHVAVAMWWERSSQADVLLGEGRFIRLKDDPSCADVAVTMADELHGQGGGTLLMRALVLRAREEGVQRFSAAMSPDNEPSHRLMRRVGPVLRDVVQDREREMVVVVPEEPADASRTHLIPLDSP
ncbi:MAG TPA: GNAT family protein [Candidatus Nanopelagicales bacterium]